MLVKRKAILLSTIGCCTLLLVGCASNVTTKTIAAPALVIPTPALSAKSVYVQIQNVTGKNAVVLQAALTQALQQKGYTIASNIADANQMISVDVLQAGKNTMTAVKTAAAAGVGGPITNAPQAAVLVPANNDVRVSITNAAVQNLTYSLITDVMYSFKIASNTSQVQQQNMGAAGKTAPVSFNVTQTSWNNYSNRIIAYATAANVPFNQAIAVLANAVVTQVTNTLPQ